MHKLINPSTITENLNYSHGVEITAPARWLEISGQVGRDEEGNIPDGIEAQAEIAMRNVSMVLAEAGMEMADLVSTTVYLINRADNEGFNRVRARWLNGTRPASTKVYISGLSSPRVLCEIQARAACA